jgi:hypothetical protein
MVFDYVAFNKPCGFINYDVPNLKYPNWSVQKIYNYVHFRSMPTNNSVFWINSQNDFETKIEKMLSVDSIEVIEIAHQWFKKINQHPPQLASERIWNAIDEICKK